MIIIGLTGSIGMGKSTVAKMFVEEGAPVFDSDAAVHALYAPGGAAVAPVEAAFAGVTKDGAIDRDALSKRVLGDASAIKQLEQIVHPLVRQAQMQFLQSNRDAGTPVVVLDIPLLFEGGGAALVDKTVVVSAPAEAQRARVLARPGMTAEKFESILARQVPDAEKRARADFVIDTGVSLEETRREVRAVLDALREQD
ncbi:MAG: dephospho-CoA kinase [Hyphomonadaceae bacterium]|nr:dephospho-CoA kinase [Hyphomonadaceae bacterium]